MGERRGVRGMKGASSRVRGGRPDLGMPLSGGIEGADGCQIWDNGGTG